MRLLLLAPLFVCAFAAHAQTAPISPLADFEYGSMGGYYTFDEVVAELDSMRADHPDLVSERVSIGQSVEGRDLWMVRISDNPDTREDEPKALYTSLHHSNEPLSLTAVVYFMHYLLEHYGSDPEVTNLVDDTELYFVPVVNPDGYVYNEQTNPEGGGLWRKNRRDNGDGSVGVDLNRNYSVGWGNTSSDPSSITYHGPNAFSEPETQAIRDLAIAYEFETAANFHSSGGYYASSRSGLDLQAAEAMAAQNGYDAFSRNGIGVGNTTPWMTEDTETKPRITAWLSEVWGWDPGDEPFEPSDQFWAPVDLIVPIAEENIRANLIVARVARDPDNWELNEVSTQPRASEPTVFSLYPNPAPSRLTVELPDNTRAVTITDVLGREVRSHNVEGSAYKVTLDLGRLTPGLYFVTMTGRDGKRHTQAVTVVR